LTEYDIKATYFAFLKVQNKSLFAFFFDCFYYLCRRKDKSKLKNTKQMKKLCFLLLILVTCACTEQNEFRISSRLRAPAYPLINIDTYTNAWLFGDTLYSKQSSHWTGK
jgi:hypothetical protein